MYIGGQGAYLGGPLNTHWTPGAYLVGQGTYLGGSGAYSKGPVAYIGGPGCRAYSEGPGGEGRGF